MSILIDRDGPITIVTIDRPAKRNAVDPATATSLRDAFAAFANDDSARVAILTGAGTAFCDGGNVRRMGEAARLGRKSGRGFHVYDQG